MKIIAIRISKDGSIVRTCAFDKDLVRIGRDAHLEIGLDDPLVSRLHAHLTRDGDRVFVQDHGSMNGTLFNGSRIQSKELETGDSLQVGGFTLWVELIESTGLGQANLDESIPSPTLKIDPS